MILWVQLLVLAVVSIGFSLVLSRSWGQALGSFLLSLVFLLIANHFIGVSK